MTEQEVDKVLRLLQRAIVWALTWGLILIEERLWRWLKARAVWNEQHIKGNTSLELMIATGQGKEWILSYACEKICSEVYQMFGWNDQYRYSLSPAQPGKDERCPAGVRMAIVLAVLLSLNGVRCNTSPL